MAHIDILDSLNETNPILISMKTLDSLEISIQYRYGSCSYVFYNIKFIKKFYCLEVL